MSITFEVSKVDPPKRPMTSVSRSTVLPSLLGGRRIEAIYESEARLVEATDVNALVQAAHDAFYHHAPLVISPDAVWFCLAQGFAHHVSAHAEELRDRFVKHQGGKATILVERADFVLGQANPWPEAFAAFSDGIAAHLGKIRDLVVADFSTTGPVERAASEVVLMDTFQAYFEYRMHIGCGIPKVSLLGTPDDWRSIRRRAAMLSEFGLEWWTRPLEAVLDAIVETSEGRIDQEFWRSLFRYQSGSGPSELTGWIHVLFPYLKVREEDGSERISVSPYLASWEESLRKAETRTTWVFDPVGPALSAIGPSLASAPVRLVDLKDGSEHSLRFVGGMFGVVQDDAGGVAPEFGWAVVHDDA